jgi:ribulose 1,5-bisphosphate carboxylase large subunit-like protein
MIDAARPGGHVLDLQVIRPDPVIELGGRPISHIDGEPLFGWADAAVAAIDARIAAGDLVEEAVDDHDVRKHYDDGAALVDDIAGSRRSLPEADVPMLGAIRRPLVARERCRTRRLRVG